MTNRGLPAIEQLTFETAAEHVCQHIPVASPSAHAGAIRHMLEGQHYDSATHIAICEDGKLLGIMTIEELLSAADEITADRLMDPEPPTIAPGADQEVAVWHAIQHNESALAVVDAQGYFKGFIPPQRLLTILLWEHEEDMTRLGGFLCDTAAAHTRHAPVSAVARKSVCR